MKTPNKEELIESLGIHFENLYHLPPLATRLYALLILTGKDGLTFEELIEATEASKSSVSTSITLLLQTEKIEYFTKAGDRKRYFRKKTNYLKTRLSNYLDQINKELKLFESTCMYMSERNVKSYEEHQKITNIYKTYLESTKAIMENTLKELEYVSY